LLAKLLKKEKKVASKLKESKQGKSTPKDKGDNRKGKRPDKKTKENRANRSEVDIQAIGVHQVAEAADPNKEAMEERPDQPMDRSSVDYLAKEAIAVVRKLENAQDIDLFVLGDKRSTVLKSAVSRQNSLSSK
jgi:hypothetical protein